MGGLSEEDNNGDFEVVDHQAEQDEKVPISIFMISIPPKQVGWLRYNHLKPTI